MCTGYATNKLPLMKKYTIWHKHYKQAHVSIYETFEPLN